MAEKTDIAIIGAGMAGASLAAAIGGRAGVTLIEGESAPGYHATGRSAAFWTESYGGPKVQPLTTASEEALAPYLHPRGCFHIAEAGDLGLLDALEAEFAGRRPLLARIGAEELHARIPGLSLRFVAAVSEPSCRDIDVAGLHADYLRAARAQGVDLRTDSEVLALSREGAGWRIDTKSGPLRAGIVVNAAGAWAGQVAAMAQAAPIPIQPCRRTVVQLLTDPPTAPDLPLVMDAAGRFYFKPEPGGRLWLTPHDETECVPQDVAPEDLDIAVAIHRFEQAVDWRIVKRERAWAGLRSFTPDRAPVYGYDEQAPDFFWFAGQGGFGIQTAPAAAALAAALLLDAETPRFVAGIAVRTYAPGRFGNQ